MTIWLENPPRRKRRTKRKSSRRRSKFQSKAWMAKIRKMRKGVGPVARRKRRTHRKRHTARRSNPPVRRRRRRSRAVAIRRRNPIRHRRSRSRVRHRRNPGLKAMFGRGRGIIGKTIEGVKNGAFVFGGEVTTGLITSFIPLASTGVVGLAVRSVAAILSGFAWGFVSPKAAVFAVAGGFASIIRAAAKDINIPVVTPALVTADLPLGLVPLKTVASTGTAGYVGAEGYVGASGYESSVPSMAGVM